MHRAERGLFDLMRGRPLYVRAGSRREESDAVLAAAVEGLTAATLGQLRRLGRGPLRLALTTSRARAMGLVTGEDTYAAHPPPPDPTSENGVRPSALSLRLDRSATPDEILRLASSVGRYSSAAIDLRPATRSETGSLTLARVARLLPAVVCARVATDTLPALVEALRSGSMLTIGAEEIEAMSAGPELGVVRVTEAPVPLEEAEDARFVLFREAGGLFEHVAILIGPRNEWPDPVPARLHSACLTGDLFGSLKCDCGDQLRGSLRIFAERGGGILLYLAQEGRGIGLGNKLRAYSLQQEGLDTVDADCTLGFGADERTYEVAVRMLADLGVSRVELLTNNPEKVRALRRGGIEVAQRRPIHGTLNRYNLPYVRAKVHRAGHWLEDMLSDQVPRG